MNVRTTLNKIKYIHNVEIISLVDTDSNIQKDYNNVSEITDYQKNKIVSAYFYSLDKSILMIYCKKKTT